MAEIIMLVQLIYSYGIVLSLMTIKSLFLSHCIMFRPGFTAGFRLNQDYSY